MQYQAKAKMTPDIGALPTRADGAAPRAAALGDGVGAAEDDFVGEGDAAEDGGAGDGARHVQPLQEGHLGLNGRQESGRGTARCLLLKAKYLCSRNRSEFTQPNRLTVRPAQRCTYIRPSFFASYVLMTQGAVI